jgi:hypothetical protein
MIKFSMRYQGDLLERLIDDMVFGKITIAQYDKKHYELN